MVDSAMDPRDLLENLLELASQTELEVRILSAAAASAEFSPMESAACRVGNRIWVVLAPDDPAENQARVLAEALAQYRSEALESRFVPPAVRDFIDRVDPNER